VQGSSGRGLHRIASIRDAPPPVESDRKAANETGLRTRCGGVGKAAPRLGDPPGTLGIPCRTCQHAGFPLMISLSFAAGRPIFRLETMARNLTAPTSSRSEMRTENRVWGFPPKRRPYRIGSRPQPRWNISGILWSLIILVVSCRSNAQLPSHATLDRIKGDWRLKSFKESETRGKIIDDLKLETTAELTISGRGQFTLKIVDQGAKSFYRGYLKETGKNNLAVVGVIGPRADPPSGKHLDSDWKLWVSDTSVTLMLPSGSEYAFERVKAPDESPRVPP
jgi:hypothetical protein